MKKKFLLIQVKRLTGVILIVLFHAGVVEARTDFQQLQVNGTVTTAVDDTPLPGVSVVVKGTSSGTTTDVDGNYSLSVPDGNSTLVFSFIGYKSVEVAVNNRMTIDVSLETDIQELGEVVVIGYGTQKKADLTGAVAVMNTDQLTERPLTRVDQALVGQMAGVRVQQTSGIPGQGFRVQIRGTGSINANNEPLYVIDGFPLALSPQNGSGDFATGSPLDNINPNDIASIQVLKDASAAAIYGSRASNGVVIITTKKGKAGKPTITFNAYGGTVRESKRVDFLDAEEWIDLATEVINYNYLRDHATYGANVSHDQATRLDIMNQRRIALGQAPLAAGTINSTYMLDDRWDPNHPQHDELMYVDWQDEIFRTGTVQNYNIAANGGTEHLNYYVSGDLLDQLGHIVGVDYKRYSARANVEVTASDRVKFGVNIAPSYSLRNDGGAEGKDQQMHLTGTIIPVVDRDIGLNANVFPNGFYQWGNSRVSPPRVLEESLGEFKTLRNLTSAYVNVKIAEGLDIKSTVNLDHSEVKVKNFMPSIVSRNRATTGRLRGNTRQTFVNENFLSYNRTLANDHNISAVIGTSFSNTKFDNWDMRGTFAGDDVTTLNAATINPDQVTATETRNVLVSFFGRAQYNYADRYLLSASIRRDGSSRFGDDTKWGIFPSLSIGWRLTNESFFDVQAISDLKLRAAWGVSGNQGGIDDYGHIALLEVANYSFGESMLSGQVPTNIPNRALSWEESETINIGADIGLLQDRIYLSADYYNKVNSNLLMDVTIPSAAGFTTVLTNIGKVENRGWELELTSQNFMGAFEWSTSLNLSHNENEVLALGPENADILGGSQDINHNILRVGEPMYTLFVVQQDGILSQADIDAGAALLGTQTAGNPRYVDQWTDTDGDGVLEEPNGTIGPEDRVLSGQPLPSHTWGISNNFRYKGFDLSVLVQGQWGGHIYSLYGRGVDRTDMGYNENRLGLWRDRWRSEEDPGAGLRGKPYSTGPRIKNTDWLYPSDYVRVRNITLGYDLGSMINVNGISGLRLYMTLENYFGSDKYDGGWNPEAVNLEGDDYGAAPIPKSMIFGLNLKL